MISKHLASTLLVIAAALVTAAASNAQDPNIGLFFDTVDINVINVEVVVTDADGQPVRGLTREEFELYDNGEPVEISNFLAIESQRPILASETAGESSQTAQEPDTRQLSLVIFIDNRNIKPQTRNQIFDNLRQYLARGLAENDQVMLVNFDQQLEVIQEFTANAEDLARAIDKVEDSIGLSHQIDGPLRLLMHEMETTRLLTNTPTDLTLEDYTEARAYQTAHDALAIAERLYQRSIITTKVLAEFSDSLAGLRGRKAILYVSDGISQRPGDALVQAWRNKFEDWALNHDRRHLTYEIGSLVRSDLDLAPAFDKLTQHASSNRVAFYPISAKNSGFVGSAISAEFGGSRTGTAVGVRSADVKNLDSVLRQGALQKLAHGTGGLPFSNSSNIGLLIDTIRHDFSTFYSLGYSPASTDLDDAPKWRRLEIKIRGKRPGKSGFKVRHTRSLQSKDPLENLQQLTLAACHYGSVDNSLEVELEPGHHYPGAKRGQYRVPVMVKIPFSQLLLLPEEEHHSGRVSLFVVVRDAAGGTSPIRRVELPIQIPNERILEALGKSAAYPLELELGEGPKRISIGLRDHLAQVDTTVNLEVDVGSDLAPGTPFDPAVAAAPAS